MAILDAPRWVGIHPTAIRTHQGLVRAQTGYFAGDLGTFGTAFLRVAYRNTFNPHNRNDNLGFRCVQDRLNCP